MGVGGGPSRGEEVLWKTLDIKMENLPSISSLLYTCM